MWQTQGLQIRKKIVYSRKRKSPQNKEDCVQSLAQLIYCRIGEDKEICTPHVGPMLDVGAQGRYE